MNILVPDRRDEFRDKAYVREDAHMERILPEQVLESVVELLEYDDETDAYTPSQEQADS